MKIIFLDIDGVMATSNDYGVSANNKWNAYRFDKKCVGVLNSILEETGADIILSSDWRHHYTLQEMKDIFAHNGIIKGPIGFTMRSINYKADSLEWGRTEEIQHWLKSHAWKDDCKWVAVDDLDLSIESAEKYKNSAGGLENFVRCVKESEGIKQTGIKEKILKYLV